MKHIKYLTALFCAVMLVSCSTDFEINAPRDESPVIFGLINAGADTNFIKITKTFLGEGSVLEYAQVRDSSEYKQKLNAYLQKEGSSTKIFLDTITIPNKESGQFYSGPTTMYYTTENIEEQTTYDLVVEAPNKTATATTNTVGEMQIVLPRSTQSLKLVATQNAPWEYSEVKTEWVTSDNIKLVEASVVLEYKEVYTDNTWSIKHFEYFVGSKRSSTDEGGETVKLTWNAEDFFIKLSKLETPANVAKRIIRINNSNLPPIDFVFTVAGLEIDTYLELEKPSTGIVQERPKYTNVTNGLGIFSSKYTQSLAMRLHINTANALVSGSGSPYVADLKFELE